MAIQIVSAILAKRAFEDESGLWHVVDPAAALFVPNREKVNETTSLVLVLTMVGGASGQTSQMSVTFLDPNQATAMTMPPGEYTWHAEPALIVITLDNIPIRAVGTHVFHVSVDDEVETELRLPVFRRGEQPAG